MLILVPQALVDEVTSHSQTDLDNLLASGREMVHAREATSSIERNLKEMGWSLEFSHWYASLLEGGDAEIELRIPLKAPYQRSMQDFEQAVAAKKQLFWSGVYLVVASVVLRLVAAAIFGSSPPAPQTGAHTPEPDGGLAFLGFLFVIAAPLCMWFAGLFKILDSKNQSRWWSLIGIFSFLVPDRNTIIVPSKGAEATMAEGAALSDW